jgi:TonB family protein
MKTRFRIIICAPLAIGALASLANAADLASAKALYASASYEEALTKLADDTNSDQPEQVDQYRALCLLALGRTDEAQASLEKIVTRNPLYRMTDDVSPRLVELFTQARKRMLPGAAKERYVQAKAAFDNGDFAAAADAFRQLLTIVGDPDARGEGVSDLRQLASGFLQLSEAALTPAPAAAPPPVVSAPATPVAAAPAFYTTDDHDVVPPVEIQRRMPVYSPIPGFSAQSFRGTLLVMIDEEGRVESAQLMKPIWPGYDNALLTMARQWRFRPATRDGVPVKFRSRYEIALKPS